MTVAQLDALYPEVDAPKAAQPTGDGADLLALKARFG